MAQVAILLNGSPDPRKTEIASALGILLGCPVLLPSRIRDALVQQTGPVASRPAIERLADDTIWRTAGLVEAGVVVDSTWAAADAAVVEAGLALAGSPRVVEVTFGTDAPLGVGPVVTVDDIATVDMDALVQSISEKFVPAE
jgi:hypothetical protein